jgi:hypothetical protein
MRLNNGLMKLKKARKKYKDVESYNIAFQNYSNFNDVSR